MSDCPSEGGSFRVTIYYREPTYELFNGRKADPYFWTFEVEASTTECAELEARRQFEEMARTSSVGWVRRIVRVDTEPPAGPVLRSA